MDVIVDRADLLRQIARIGMELAQLAEEAGQDAAAVHFASGADVMTACADLATAVA